MQPFDQYVPVKEASLLLPYFFYRCFFRIDRVKLDQKSQAQRAVNGFHVAHKFYAPKYDVDLSNSKKDFRSVIYWDPDIQTDANGHASFSFYSLGLKGNYRVTVEGIDQNGNIGSKLIHYRSE